jgi:hypothetical protein
MVVAIVLAVWVAVVMDDVDASVVGHRAVSKPGFVTCSARFLGNVFSKVFLLYTSGPLGMKLKVSLPTMTAHVLCCR